MMKQKILAMVVVATFSGIAQAANIDATDPKRILKIVQQQYDKNANLTTDDYGEPLINVEVNDIKYGIYFYNCDKQTQSGCDSIQFAASWEGDDKSTLEKINDWNRDTRYGRAYLDRNKDPLVEMDINMAKKVSEANLKESFEIWHTITEAFANHLAEE